MTTQTYLIVDSGGNVINAISYDGVQPYTPPAGTTLQLDPAQAAGAGWTYANGTFTPPPDPVPTP